MLCLGLMLVEILNLAFMNYSQRSHTNSIPSGMVTSPSALASEIGASILRSGGNAVEAAVAVAIALGVTYPHFCGLGGDAFLLVSSKDGEVISISGIGQSARNITGYESQLPTRGPRSMLTSAGALSAYENAFEYNCKKLHGRKRWKDLFDPSIELARNGFEISESERFWLGFREQEKSQLPDIFEHFTDSSGLPYKSQQYVRRADLAHTLSRVAHSGSQDFYMGELAKEFACHFKEVGAPLDLDDLAITKARVEPALKIRYRQGTLYAHPPPTQGVTTLEIMGILNQFDLQKIQEGSANHYHLLIEAIKLAFIDRNRFLGDPDFADVPIDWLLSLDHLKKLSQQVDLKKARSWPDVFQHGDTVFVGTVDAMGNSVSLLATVYFDWGSGVVIGDTGIIWHNRGAAFSLDPTHPNVLRPGKRPFHTLNPGLYLKDNGAKIIYGTQGADGQPQTLAAILTRLIDYDMTPLTALSSPRFLLGKTFSSSTENLKIEENVGASVMTSLELMDHKLEVLSALNPLMGHPGAILVDQQGNVQGAHDPRSDGLAIKVS